MNAITEIIKRADNLFEEAWSREADRIRKVADKIDDWNKNVVGKPVPNSSWKSRYFLEAPCDEFVVVEMMGYDKDYIEGMYNRLIRSEYNRMKNTVSELHTLVRKGLEKYLEDNRKEYFAMLTAKLTEALTKHLSGWSLDDDYKVDIYNSEKGYIISARVKKDNEKAYIETSCVPAGGWNIQCFHYRYRSKFKVLED